MKYIISSDLTTDKVLFSMTTL